MDFRRRTPTANSAASAAVAGAALARLPLPANSGLPTNESRLRRWTVRLMALVALATSLYYLVWRTGWTLHGAALWLALPFLALEVHAAVGFALFVFSTWDVDPRLVSAPPDVLPRIVVLVPTYNEGLEVLLPTVAAAVSLDPTHDTWVLDDGDRLDVAQMARALGARYVTRPVHDHAKAGNINHALALVDADLVAILDADHVPLPGFLTRLLGYFSDPRVALVQSPQEFYNLNSFEHAIRDPRVHEESLFYRVVQPGKNRWGAAFWCGTNAILRLAALRSVGGVATETITEDLHTTLRLHRAGWRSVYHHEVLAQGLAAAGPDQYLAQRLRWGRGAMQVLRSENPLLGRGLRPAQRIAYAYSLSAWFDCWRTLGLTMTPVVVLLTGVFPLTAPPVTFLAAFMATYVLQQSVLVMLGRGWVRLGLFLMFDYIRMPANLVATLSLVRPRAGSFRVTAKGRTGDRRARAKVPALLTTLAATLVGTAVWTGLTLAGLTAVRYRSNIAALIALGWLVASLTVVLIAIRRIRHVRFGVERREAVRFDVRLPARLGPGRPDQSREEEAVEVTDLSLGGAEVRAGSSGWTIGDSVVLQVALATATGQTATPLRLTGVVRSQVQSVLGIEFGRGQWVERAAIATALFHAAAAAGRAAGEVEPGATAGSAARLARTMVG